MNKKRGNQGNHSPMRIKKHIDFVPINSVNSVSSYISVSSVVSIIILIALTSLISGCSEKIDDYSEFDEFDLPADDLSETKDVLSDEDSLLEDSEDELLASDEELSGDEGDGYYKNNASGFSEDSENAGIPFFAESGCMGFLAGSPEEIETAALAGATWIRPHSGPFAWQWIEPKKGGFDFRQADEWVKAANDYDIAVLGTIWPYADWDQETCRPAGCEVLSNDQFYAFYADELKGMLKGANQGIPNGIPNSRCAPCNYDDYKAFLTKLVERYDGDGKDDMPDLFYAVKHWEILNEPEMNSPDLTFYKGSPEEYVQILKASSEAIKAACPDCIVVQGGAAGNDEWMIKYWNVLFDLGAAQYFDVANIHFIGNGDISSLNVNGFKAVMQAKGINKPVWVTEAEYRPEHSDSDVMNSFEGALKQGAEKIFFTRFIIGQKGPPEPGEYSAVYDGLGKKCGE